MTAENKKRLSIILKNHYQWCVDNGRDISWYKTKNTNT